MLRRKFARTSQIIEKKVSIDPNNNQTSFIRMLIREEKFSLSS